jgi:hypothetical protein
MEGLSGNKAELRRQQVARYYFVMKHPMSQIGDALNIPYKQVFEIVQSLKGEYLKDLKKDIRKYKKPLEQMHDILFNLDYQRSLLMNKYITAENDLTSLREAKRMQETNSANLPTILKLQTSINHLNANQQEFLSSYRAVLKQKVDTLASFGLTGEEAVKFVIENNTGNTQIDIKVVMLKIAGVLKNIIPEKDQPVVFNTLLKEINIDESSQ